MRIYDFGDPQVPGRFWDKVVPEPNSGCWLWEASQNKGGYGKFMFQGYSWVAHRFILWKVTGTLGNAALHSCQTRCCVNPHHLRWGSQSENMLDAVKDGSHNMSSKTHCPSGHAYNQLNTGFTNGGQSRYCRRCKNSR